MKCVLDYGLMCIRGKPSAGGGESWNPERMEMKRKDDDEKRLKNGRGVVQLGTFHNASERHVRILKHLKWLWCTNARSQLEKGLNRHHLEKFLKIWEICAEISFLWWDIQDFQNKKDA